MGTSQANSELALVAPWRRIAVGLAAIAVSLTGALVIVAAVANADALSTVALALAILSFGAQLVIAISQGQAANEQLRTSERINAESRMLLADIRATTGGVLQAFQSQFDTVLRHALGEAIPEAVNESTGPDRAFDASQFESRVAQKIDAAIRESDQLQVWRRVGQTGLGVTGGHLLGLSPGDFVHHQKWGVGRVLSVTGEGRNAEADVLFDGAAGRRRLLLAWTPLRRYHPERDEERGDEDEWPA